MVKKKKEDSKFNILAANRKSKFCMGPLVADDGYVFVASDLNSGEPTVLLNYSEDKTLYNVLYAMRNKRPYWENNLLLTDSLYVTTMSATPMLNSLLKSLGEEWLDLWITDNDKAKKALGTKYAVCKMVVLAMLYGLGKKSLGRHLAEADAIMSESDVSDVYEGFWNSLPEAKNLRDFFTYEFKQAKKKKQCYLSPMGFPLPTDDPHKALNYNIQSAVSSWMRRCNKRLFTVDYAVLTCVIHDEIVAMVKEDKVETYRAWLKQCQDDTNEHFGLKYPLLLGFTVSKDFYGLKG